MTNYIEPEFFTRHEIAQLLSLSNVDGIYLYMLDATAGGYNMPYPYNTSDITRSTHALRKWHKEEILEWKRHYDALQEQIITRKKFIILTERKK